jgi:hypothetical protein
MKNIGILTFHFTTNYGAVLQAYSVQKLLTELGYNAELIDYRQISSFRTYAKALFLNRYFLSGFFKVLRFLNFYRNYLHTSEEIAYSSEKLNMIINRYDAVVVGSDEVWKINSFRGYDPGFFLGFPEFTGKKLSFSASVGSSETFGDKKNEICAWLNKFDGILVRDSRTEKLLKKECGLHSKKSLDPTLLVKFPELERENEHKDDYILIYGALSNQEQEYAKFFADSKKCRIVSIGYYNDVADINLVGAGVEDWINYIRFAKLVFTIFFHGVIFSLKYHREAYVFQRKEKDYKIMELARDLSLEIGDLCKVRSDTSSVNCVKYCLPPLFQAEIEQSRKVIESYFRNSLN